MLRDAIEIDRIPLSLSLSELCVGLKRAGGTRRSTSPNRIRSRQFLPACPLVAKATLAIAHRRARNATALMIGRDSTLPIVTSDLGKAAKARTAKRWVT